MCRLEVTHMHLSWIILWWYRHIFACSTFFFFFQTLLIVNVHGDVICWINNNGKTPSHAACIIWNWYIEYPNAVRNYKWYVSARILLTIFLSTACIQTTVETPYSTIPYTTMFDITRWAHGSQNLQRPIRTLIVLLGFRIKQIFV